MKVLLFANTDWYLFNFRRSLAEALRDAGHDLLLVSPEGIYGPKLRELGFKWIPAPMARRSLNPLREALLVNWLRHLMATEQVDLVHSFTIKPAVYGSLAARLAGVPARVSAVAGMGYVFTSKEVRALALRPIVRALMKLSLGGTGSRLILQNPVDLELFGNARIVSGQNIRMIPGSGVNCERFSPSTDAKREADPFRVVLPARLLWDKGLREFVDAAEELASAGRSMEFLLAGEPDPGNPAAVPQLVLDAWRKSGTIKLLGHVEDMPALLRSADVVVLPSYREGLPKGLIEAAACGIALITTDVPGCREVVTDMVDGLLVPVRDSKAIALAIARLQDDDSLRGRLGAAALRKAREEFDERIVIQKTFSVYKELVGTAESSTSHAQLDAPTQR